MTHAKKLNAILHVLLYNQKNILESKPIDKRMTFEFICNTVAEVTEKWEVEYLRKILFNDGYIEMGKWGDGEPPIITHKGIKFVQQGAYEGERKNQEIDQKIKHETLKKFQYDKWAFAIAILSLIIAVISLLKK